ncbi:MAG TPA: PfkB family carbohydrate kinase [Acidobacteriota bacterium]|nr:PfkB family carbohydrate kinase [Acidobacteriota bacterium]
MSRNRLEKLLELVSKTRILVFGDYFLDQYWVTDPELEEVSLETRLPANQVVKVRLSAGAAGTVANNLAALGVKEVVALGIIGDDGNGLELIRSLQGAGVTTDQLILSPDRLTPTYTKPLFLQPDASQVEGQRIDIKNRTVTPWQLENELVQRLRQSFLSLDGVIVLDQAQEEDCGSVTTSLRQGLIELGTDNPDQPCLADSRTRIHKFRSVVVKVNEHEAARGWEGVQASFSEGCRAIHKRTNRPVVVTRGAKGVIGFDGQECRELSAIPSSGPLDIVGAGDSFSAGFLSALAATGDFWEALQLGILAAAVTVRKLGTTGTASPEEILRVSAEIL